MVFALFSLGLMEILILGGLCFLPVTVAVVVLAVLRTTAPVSQRPAEREPRREEDQRLRLAELEAENQRLREEIARLKQKPSSGDFMS